MWRFFQRPLKNTKWIRNSNKLASITVYRESKRERVGEYKAGAAVGGWPYLLSRKDKPTSPRDFTVQSLEVSVDRSFKSAVNFTRCPDDVFEPNKFAQDISLSSSVAASSI